MSIRIYDNNEFRDATEEEIEAMSELIIEEEE